MIWGGIVLLTGAVWAGPLVPPPSSIGALGLTPAGFARVEAASRDVALAHLRNCGESPSCPGKTVEGNGYSTLSKFLLTVCDGAGLCGGFVVSARGRQDAYSAPGGGTCTQTAAGGNPQAGAYTSDIDGQTYQDPNDRTGSAWQVTTPYYCSGNFNAWQDAPNEGAAGQARVLRRSFTYSTSDCSLLSGGDFTELGTMTGVVNGRQYYVQRVKEKNKCAGKVLQERYNESGTPPNTVSVTELVVASTASAADYLAASAGGAANWWALTAPVNEWPGGGVLLATGTPTYPAPPPAISLWESVRVARNGPAVAILSQGLTLEATNVYRSGVGEPVPVGQIAGPSDTPPASSGLTTISGTVVLADGQLPAAVTTPARTRGKTFEGEWARLMVKHSTNPILGLGGKFSELSAKISSAAAGQGAFSTEFCIPTVIWGTPCVDMADAGFWTAFNVIKFFFLVGTLCFCVWSIAER